MSRFFYTLVVAFLAAAFSLPAAQVRTFQDGLKRVGDNKPLILFCYGANFNKFSEQVYDTYIKHKNNPLGRMLSRETYVVVPVFQQATPMEKREFEKVMGKRGLPGGVWNMPSLIVVDGKGNFRGAVQSSEEMSTPEKAAEALASLLEDFNKQQKLLARAEKIKGPSRNDIMREALSISRVRVPGHGTYDPANNGLGEKLQVMSVESANEHCRRIIAGGNFTLIERQMILVALAGHMRRGKAPVHRLRAIYTEIRNIDPTSIYGIYAEGALQLWVVPREAEASSANMPKPANAQDNEAN